MASPSTPAPGKRRGLFLLIAVGVISALAAAAAVALAVNISQKKQEAANPFFRVVELTDDTADPSIWGKNFPLQYDGYLRTVDQTRTRYGGSEAVPHPPTQADPRTVVAQSRLEEDPRLKTMWAGYAFSKDFREERGHAYMLADQIFTERQQVTKQPGTCLNCHASMYNIYKTLGNGDLNAGFDAINKMPYMEAKNHAKHPVACIDCHDSQSMQLRVTRPAFMQAMARMKAAQGVQDYNVNRDASRQEMRSYVCGQCHVEYYFKGPEKTLTYPWDKGLKVDNIIAYYEENGHKDWTHADTGAPALKAQHPEFEMWNQGIHARSGVSCSDCHMPYTRVGAQKISDHHVRSPLLNINRACQTCHHFSEDELRARAEALQERTFRLRNQALDALMGLVADVKAAKAAGKTDQDLAGVHSLQRRAQFMIDFVEAENSVGFHAPEEAARILGEATDLMRQAQILVRDPAFKPQLPRETPPAAGDAHPGPGQRGKSIGGASR
ncbi:MAG TPA: ammonia-forming cytochrome c nitrite reductase subunit c552 [Myxococcus sp.]|nr:ammonia-forming cytochrome c nitrite reductase subunit c552 [Myxococcus sp.]